MRRKAQRTLAAWLAACLLLLSFGSLAAAAPSVPVSLELGQVSGAPGDTVTMSVSLDPGQAEVYGLKATLSYDPAKLEVVSAADALSDSNVEVNDPPLDTNTPGSVQADLLYLIGIASPSTAFTVDFRIKSAAAAGDTPVEVQSATYSVQGNPAVPIDSGDISQGKVTIAPPADATPPELTAKTDSTALATGDNLQLTFDENVEAVAGKTITIIKAADDSVAATIAVDDATQVIVADNVATIDPIDDLVAGTAYYARVEAGAFQDAAGNPFAGIADESWTFATAAAEPTEPAEPETAAFAIGSVSGKPGALVQVPVTLTQASAGLAAYGMQIGFDPAALEVESIDGGASGDSFFSAFDNAAGTLKTAWVDATGGDAAIDSGALFTVSLRIKDGASAGAKTLAVAESDPSTFTATDASRAEMQKTLTAGGVTVLPTFAVAYDGNGADGGAVPTDALAYASGETVTAKGNIGSLTKSGYYFVGWNTEADGSGTAYAADATFAMNEVDVKLYATWAMIPVVVTPTPQDDDGVDILVNGKVESAGKATTDTVNGRKVTTIAVDPKKLKEKLASEASGAVVTIPVAATSDVIVGELSGQMVKEMEQKRAVLNIKTGQASYTLPAEQIDIGAVSDRIGADVSLADIKVRIEIASPTADALKQANAAANAGSFAIVGAPVEFNVKGVYGDRTIDVTSFNAYVERSIAIPDGVDPNRITTGVVIEPDGTVRHVPTKVVRLDGKYYAQINSLTNSTYAVVWHPAAFADAADHWAQAAIDDLASRMVVNGKADGRFHPNDAVTRAEFASILVKGLGLPLQAGQASFSDVKDGDWYAGAIGTAYAYGLIQGAGDGTFRPQEQVTREQAMTMLAKAMALTGLKDEAAAGAADAVLQPFADAAEASSWALDGIEACIRTGLVSGRDGSTLAPSDRMTRAEVAKTVEALLKQSGLI